MDYNREDILKLLEELNLNEHIEPKEIPSIDLYMDQVITLFESNLSNSKRYDEDKLLTKTMINNYTKDKLLIPAKKKKYSKNHIILMILIYNLKQNLSILDIKSLFNDMVVNLQQEGGEKINLEEIYKKFLHIKNLQTIEAEDQINALISKVEEQLSDKDDEGYEKLLITVLCLINSANTQKRLAEKIIDKYFRHI
ncbi:hypothetical protein U732_4115 [Clostridium argentinense CDC 2741]|uniref:DUF1836 domain-containing protein n=1 Tax=Clostridium argentinense CDC 2741 TaxID=1418104 RepID=A0A0C1UM78_9CLOT|nr:DUF1836 domain-containing protein [Clostridium argentinense]ARC84942.1 hypothetical protein RSJ17_10655 [Clostridium argentinense]KIE48335.1 hypothetical protein U732_4115 [Clostridium argentinense CDC 2741]NFF40677.1 DUF1836 domain-containing protein [Clostridium argentinense]NFP52352.1 DUF1836 domain-containing protein [Clostridium argentinense]NFP73846.1 DUF1836 domain-containing protein [Clostridium argentinense]